MKIKNILLDLDGTIIDSEEGIINSLKHTLKYLGIKCPSVSELKSLIGPPIIETFKNEFRLNEEKALEAIEVYRKHYTEYGILEYLMYTNIDHVLLRLHQAGFHLYISTGKPTYYAQMIVEDMELDHLFIEIAGSNLDNTRTQKIEVIDYLIKNNGLNPEETIIVGDRKYDIEGGIRSNLNYKIGVLYGFGSKEELTSAGADHLVSDCHELQDFLIETFANE